MVLGIIGDEINMLIQLGLKSQITGVKVAND